MRKNFSDKHLNKGQAKKESKTSSISLGKEAKYADQYTPSLLEPIPRYLSRQSLGLSIAEKVPFKGADVWTAYEVSWLDNTRKPHIAVAFFEFAHDSQNLIESKSFKYYLNSFNQTCFDSWATVERTMQQDLFNVAKGAVSVSLKNIDDICTRTSVSGVCVDSYDIIHTKKSCAEDKIFLTTTVQVKNQQLYSHLLRTNCPVTGQPDWATIWIEYSGQEILPASFLTYVVSLRQHQDYHENCVEKFFMDIMKYCKPQTLSVYARYTRRGGLDINPFRTNTQRSVPNFFVARQ